MIYCPLDFVPSVRPIVPIRDRTPEDTVNIEDPVIVEIAERLNVHPAVVCVKWAVQRGQVPVPFAVNNREHYLANIACTVSEPLTVEDMQAIAKIRQELCRLIKGQVFLWEGARDWEDLWDPDGVIVDMR